MKIDDRVREEELGNWGKIYESVFERSMVGSGSVVYAVWSYCIAKARPPDGIIELNPIILGAILGEKAEAVERAIKHLCSSDARSHTAGMNGKRLAQIGPLTFQMVNWDLYRGRKTPAQIREYNRRKKAEQRARERAARGQ